MEGVFISEIFKKLIQYKKFLGHVTIFKIIYGVT